MKSFNIKVTTKLGSIYQNTIVAIDREEALKKAGAKYPLHKEIVIEGEEVSSGDVGTETGPFIPALPSSISVARLQKSQVEKGRDLMIRGAVIGGAGIVLSVGAFLAGWIVGWFLLAVGYGLVDFFRGLSLYRQNKDEPQLAGGLREIQ